MERNPAKLCPKNHSKNRTYLAKRNVVEYHAEVEKIVEDYAAKIGKVFMEALNAGDSKKILEIGNAVEFLKTFQAEEGDRYREKILHLKRMSDETGQKWPIRYVARFLRWPDMTGADGFAQIRRMCKELKLPLAESGHKTNKPSPRA